MARHGCYWLVLCFTGGGLAWAQDLKDISIDDLNEKYRLVGKLGRPLGVPLKVEGIPVDRNTKDAGTDLVVQRIDGQVTQADLRIDLRPFFGKFGEQRGKMRLPELELGKTYAFEGYESASYFSTIPCEAMEETGPLGILPPGFYAHLEVYKASAIPPIHFAPAELVDRDALLEGRATSKNGKSFVSRDDWRVLVDDRRPWPKDVEGKLVEGRGIVRKDPEHGFRLDASLTGLVKLEDQVGREVRLRGAARCRAGSFWWFEYRGTKLYVEEMEKLPGWTEESRWRPVVIRGTLEKAKLPRIDDVTRERNPAVEECYIVRKATWEPCSPLLAPERLPVSD